MAVFPVNLALGIELLRMKITPPAESQWSLPHQYVAHVADTNVASIFPAGSDTEGAIQVALVQDALLWSANGETLRIGLPYLSGAQVSTRWHGQRAFVGLSLLFGHVKDSGGVYMVTALPEHEQWFKETAAKLQSIIPGGVQWTIE